MLTEEQKKKRLGKITSSNAAAVLGLDPFKTPLQAWLDITGRAPDVDNKAIERGNLLEPAILQYPALKHGLRREDAPFRRHPRRPIFGDSTDALYYDGDDLVMIGEGKSASLGIARFYGDEGTDEMPHSTLVQSHWHLAHWPEVDRCSSPVLVGGYRFEFREYVTHRDEELEGMMLDDCAKWHRDYVVNDTPPPLEADDTQWVQLKYPRNQRPFMADTPEIERLAREKAAASERVKQALKDEERAKNRLRMLLKDHEGVDASWGKVTYRNNKDSQYIDYEALIEELSPSAELIAKYTKTKPGARALRVTIREKK